MFHNINSTIQTDRSHPAAPPRLRLPTPSNYPLPRLRLPTPSQSSSSLPPSMKVESAYNLTKAYLIKKGFVNPNLEQTIRELEDFPSVYDYITRDNVSDMHSISPERGLILRSPERGIRSIERSPRKSKGILTKTHTINLNTLQKSLIIGQTSNTTNTHSMINILSFTLPAICISLGIKYHLSPDSLSVLELYREILRKFSDNVLSDPPRLLDIERIVDSSSYVEEFTKNTGAGEEETKGGILLIGALLLTTLLLGYAIKS